MSRSLLYPVLLTGLIMASCGGPTVKEEPGILDTNDLQDGTEVEKTIDIDTPATKTDQGNEK